ncbi:MAG TPA: DEAD/DEAH box helicase, partial [Massilibacterium sp.]|nr:DEAD/DEAH box helicase [Massilibacterium sp.]
RIPVRYALTGTPVVKEGEEIWKILHFLYPDRFPGYWQFLERYFELYDNGFGQEVGKYKRKEELQEILSLISTNRKRKDVMKWLPNKQYQNIKLEMNPKQTKMYENIRDTFEHEDKVDAPSVLAQMIRLRQTTSFPNILDSKVSGEKEKFIMEWLQDHPDEPVIIFSTFTTALVEMAKKLRKKGYKLGSITGKQSKAVRDVNGHAFQKGKINVLLCNIKAAGVGLTLDRGETAIFLDKEYNPSDNEQAEDRIIPTTKERNHSVTIISLVMKDTLDEVIDGLLKHKYDITQVINNGGLEALERLWKEVKS